MKKVNLLVFMTQLGLSVALPLGGFILLAVWLHQRFGWGVWVIIAGVVLGLVCAIDGLRSSLKAMQKMAGEEKEDKPPIAFNDHD